MKKLLVTGASGLLGSHVARRAAGRFDTLGVFQSFQPPDFPGRLESLDLADAAAVRSRLDDFRPELIIHCAALADADRAQREPDLARRLNVDATATLAQAARRLGAKLLFVSTDLVFDGRKGAPYVEDDPPCPLSLYGQTKLEAEQAVRAGCDAWLIARTSLIVGPSPRGNRGLDEKLGLALREGRAVKLFVDEFRCPITAGDLAAAMLELADSPHTGVFHLVGSERLSRYEIGMRLARRFGWSTETIEAKSTRDVPMNPPRPADLVLDNAKARQALKTPLRGLTDALASLSGNSWGGCPPACSSPPASA
ncbi:MAG: SDR family oxidoreductase [Verrucomicrobia bacterium]|nr:SDR family oxidoreductase [Verrucomicrobiota bacterium]